MVEENQSERLKAQRTLLLLPDGSTKEQQTATAFVRLLFAPTEKAIFPSRINIRTHLHGH